MTSVLVVSPTLAMPELSESGIWYFFCNVVFLNQETHLELRTCYLVRQHQRPFLGHFE